MLRKGTEAFSLIGLQFESVERCGRPHGNHRGRRGKLDKISVKIRPLPIMGNFGQGIKCRGVTSFTWVAPRLRSGARVAAAFYPAASHAGAGQPDQADTRAFWPGASRKHRAAQVWRSGIPLERTPRDGPGALISPKYMFKY